MSARMPSFFDKQGLQLLLFGGKGGVGKTTCATAAALRMSALAPSRSLLLVSTDPAHSDSGQPGRSCAPRQSAECWSLTPSNTWLHSASRTAPMLREIAAAGTFLDDEDINQFLSLSLPGLDELMAFFEISSWVEARRYDCIVVDTAPSGHTLRLLAMPELIRRWLGMLEALLAKRRYMRRVFSRDSSPDRLDLFVTKWKSSLQRMESLLRDPARSQFVPVTIAEPLGVHVTLALFKDLLGRKIPVSDLIVNRLHFERNCPACSAAASVERFQIQQLLAGIEVPCSAWGIELFAEEVRGLELLSEFWAHARRIISNTGECGQAWLVLRTGRAASGCAPVSRDAVCPVCRQRRRGQDNALVRHRRAAGPRLPRASGFCFSPPIRPTRSPPACKRKSAPGRRCFSLA